MARLIVVSGTDTEVGKTWVGARLVEALRAKGMTVAVRKPVQSFAPDDERTDAEVLAGASGEPVERVTPRHRWYPLALAPPMAADSLGRERIELKDLLAETDVPGEGVCLVEGVGGPRSPLAHDGDTVTLARGLDAEAVILVAPSGLGAINAVLLSASAFSPLSSLVYLNRFDERDQLHRRNRAWLETEGKCLVASTIAELAELVGGSLAARARQVG